MDILNLAKHAPAAALLEAISAGAELEARDQYGRTALMLASRWNDPAAVKALIDSGADLAARDPFGNSSLFYALNAREERSAGNGAVLESAEASQALVPATDPSALEPALAASTPEIRVPEPDVEEKQSTYQQRGSNRVFRHWELRALYNHFLNQWNEDSDLSLDDGSALAAQVALRAFEDEYDLGWQHFLEGYSLASTTEGDPDADADADAEAEESINDYPSFDADDVYDSKYWNYQSIADGQNLYDDYRVKADYMAERSDGPSDYVVDIPGVGLCDAPGTYYLAVFSEVQASGFASYLASGEWIAVGDSWSPDGSHIDEDDISEDH